MTLIKKTFPGGVELRFNVDSSIDIKRVENAWSAEYTSNGFGILNGDTVIDIGAHIGTFTAYAAKLARDGIVYSFEPHPGNFRLLKSNCRENGIRNTKLTRNGVREKRGKCRLFTDPENTGGHSTYGHGPDSVPIECTTLEDIFTDNGIDRCDFLKIDCEGGEYGILAATPSRYLDKTDKIVLEYHGYIEGAGSLLRIVRLLGKKGFQVIIRPITTSQGVLYARKSTCSAAILKMRNYSQFCLKTFLIRMGIMGSVDRKMGHLGVFVRRRFPGMYYTAKGTVRTRGDGNA